MPIDELLKSYDRWIKSVARAMRRTYRLPTEDEEDICAAVRLRLVANHGRVDFTLRTWDSYIKTTIANTARTELGRILKHRTNVYSLDAKIPGQETGVPETWADRVPDPHAPPAESLPLRFIAHESLSALRRPVHRKMAEMHMMGATNQEIAERLRHKNGKPYSHQTVSVVLKRWRRHARKLAAATPGSGPAGSPGGNTAPGQGIAETDGKAA